MDSDLLRMRDLESEATKEAVKGNITIGELLIIRSIMFVARMVWKGNPK